MATIGDCDRTPCPVAGVGDVVDVELDAHRRRALGVERVSGRVQAVSPYTHSLQVDGIFVGGHRSSDVVRRRP